jgi:8-oxo-dGTP pyrophosphatase MutT (NUDIX family)
MRIARDGTWYHQGQPIGREAMVRLFATVLRREPDGSHVLVTPVEKLAIEVEATAFRALTMTMEGSGEARRIGFALDSGDAVIAGPAHPLSVVDTPDGPSPRLAVRHGLEAELARPLVLRACGHRARRGSRSAGRLVRRRLLLAGERMSLVERLVAALALAGPLDLLAGDLAEEMTAPLREAAVLVAITDRPEPGVILTHRSHGLRDHGGQIAFPGGRIDEGEDARAAALREAWEELRLDPAKVRILGEADHYRTITGFGVTPVVAMIPPDLPLVANPGEVDDWFEAPLAFVLDPNNHQIARRSTRAGSGPIMRSCGTSGGSGARPRRCSSICRGARDEGRSALLARPSRDQPPAARARCGRRWRALRRRGGARRLARHCARRPRPCHPARARRGRPPPRGRGDQGGPDRDRSRHRHRCVVGNDGRSHHLRCDLDTDGRRATVAFTDDWAADAARRDFTINALYADPFSGEVIDHVGGEADIAARRVRFIGEPLQRIAEDHLRILRFFRFHARFGEGAPDAAALDACRRAPTI